MSNVLPRPDEVFLILCEDARQEMDSKLSLSGIFIGPVIVVPKGTKIANINVLFVWFVRGGQGQFAVNFELSGPTGFQTVKVPQGQLIKPPSDGAAAAFAFKPLVGAPIGTYKASLSLDGNKYEQSFDVREAP